jgi:hypothetical protein
MANARNLVMRGKFDEATTEYTWLWNNMVKAEPAMIGVHGSFLAGDIGRLISQHEPAREAFAKIRDEAEARLQGKNKSWEDLDDWIVLNETLDQTDKTLAWFDRIKGQEGGAQTIERYAFRLERLLAESGRLGDLGRLEKDPMGKLRTKHAMVGWAPPGGDAAQKKEMQEVFANMFRNEAATLYTSLLAAGREKDAAEVGAEAIKLDDTGAMRLALVKKAAENKAARMGHLDWLREAGKEEGVEAVRAEVEKQLGRAN